MTTPPDLAMMLSAEERLAFDSLPDRRRRRYIEPIVRASRPDTREHRIALAIRRFREESER